ncbi:MAG: hypothetical protein IPK07_17750 [Deltaproteobacteria bacterium]|nr:hypothetical protein [Deltaproteobacteria bacterium]
MPEQPPENLDAKIAALIAELRRDFPQKSAELERYLHGQRFQKLDPARRLDALYILRGALQDATRKVVH